MPSTVFWSITNQGKVYTLSTAGGQQWDELTYCGMEFKRVAAVDWCAWGIGGDHQMYVYVFATDVPIRFKEISFQNQRWNPKEGFCSRLLPTDRPAWSSEDGLVARPRERIKLPTLSWQWEGDWRVEHNFDGQAADPEGWMYAIDFPATYTNEKGWMSYVRRRKWTRLRHYVSTNHWANVPSIHDDPVLEPFIDVSVGGQEIPGGNGETLAVWTVTVLGRIMFRTDTNSTCPEGEKWVHILTPQGGDVNQLSVGPTGLLWAIMWNGSALVRLGVTRTKITGSHWAEVPPPNDSSKLLQVSVGTNSVWAITRDSKVWFRKGVRGSEAGEREDSATGSGWVEMVGEMNLLTVGQNDQVWALSADERRLLFFRTSITPQELCGKTWKAILLPRQSRTECYSSGDENVTRETGNSTPRLSQILHVTHDSFASGTNEDGQVVLSRKISGDSLKTSDVSSSSPSKDPQSISNNPLLYETKIKANVSFEETQSDCEESKRSRPNTPSTSCNPGSETPKLTQRSRASSLTSLNGPSWMSSDDTGYYDDTYTDFSWAWISGSGCLVDGQNPPNWFGSGLHGQQAVISEPWRKEIFKLLISRQSREIETFSNYEQAIDKASWISTGIAQVLSESRHNQWIDCKLELEKTGVEHGFESATLRCFSHGGALADWQKVVLNMNSVTCVVQASDRLKPVLTIYTASLAIEQRPLRLSFTSDTDLEDWISLLNTTCCELQGVRGGPSLEAAWSLTKRGDVFTHDPSPSGELAHPSEMFWHQMGGHLHKVESCSAGVVWGIGYNHKVWVYSGGWGGGFFKGMDSSGPNIHPMSDVRCMYIYENQRWNPLTGFSNRGLPTDRYMWSDKTGRYECTKENSKLPSMHWQWMTDWMIDFNTPGGVDREGWQYAKDFPMSYHNYKGLTDYVRRRRWFRKCKLITSGPWEELDSVHLLDVSFQVDDNSGSTRNTIQLWAVSIKGEVLCRMGVTKSCPKGSCWEHIPLEHPVTSISIGGVGDVWVITKYGGVYLRHGITEYTPTGSVWFNVAPPERGGPLCHISAGPTSVWAVDNQGSLWFRQEIMPIFPEGTSWKHICGNMRCISVGPQDEVWGIVDSLGSTTGVVCHRVGISKENKVGNGWEYGIGGGWSYISVRGFTLESDQR